MSLESAFDLAQQVTPRLLPLLPYLIEGSKQIKQQVLDQLKPDTVKNALEVGEQLWKRLKPKIDKQPEIKETVEAAAKGPADPQNEEALSKAIETILKDESVRSSVSEILHASTARGVELESFVEVGDVYARVRGVEIKNIQELQGGKVKSRVKARNVLQGGDVTGMVIGSTPAPEPPKPDEKKG